MLESPLLNTFKWALMFRLCQIFKTFNLLHMFYLEKYCFDFVLFLQLSPQ